MGVSRHSLRCLVLLMWGSSVFSLTPKLLSDTADAYVFEGENATLTWEIESVDGYAIVWMHIDTVDGKMVGDFIYTCSRCAGQESCRIEGGLGQKYSLRNDRSNVYELSVLNADVTKAESNAYFQATYAQIVNCETSGRLSNFRLLQSARVFFYERPLCISSRGSNNDAQLTCSWGPRFYAEGERQAQTNLTLPGSISVVKEHRLPFGVIKLINTSFNQEIHYSAARCEVTLPGGAAMQYCEFHVQEQNETSVVIQPLAADISVGQTQEMRCDIQPNSTLERRWTLCSETGECTEITLPTATIAGEVTFSALPKETLYLTPHRAYHQAVIECFVEVDDGSRLSAFALVSSTPAVTVVSASSPGVTSPQHATRSSTTPITFHTSPRRRSTSRSTNGAQRSTTGQPNPTTVITQPSQHGVTTLSHTTLGRKGKPTQRGNPSSDGGSGGGGGGGAGAGSSSVIAAVIVILLLVVAGGIAVVVYWRRRQGSRLLKQPPVSIVVAYDNMASANSSELLTAVNEQPLDKQKN